MRQVSLGLNLSNKKTRQHEFLELLIDDCSHFTPAPTQVLCIDHHTGITSVAQPQLMLCFPDRLGRSGLRSYPGWWHSFLHALNVARQLGARMIIHVESDAYSLSTRLADHIRNINSGWTTLWSEHYLIPETAVRVK